MLRVKLGVVWIRQLSWGQWLVCAPRSLGVSWLRRGEGPGLALPHPPANSRHTADLKIISNFGEKEKNNNILTGNRFLTNMH